VLPAPGPEVRDAGIATHVVPSPRLPDLTAALEGLGTSGAGAGSDPAQLEALLRSFEEPGRVRGRVGGYVSS
jgi:hypothetical protein